MTDLQQVFFKKNGLIRLTEMCFQSRRALPLFFAWLLTLSMAHASELRGVNFASLPGDTTEITLSFSDTPPEPKGYTIEKPARIALDLPGVTSALESKYHNLGLGNAKRMTVIDTNDRSRVILDLVELVPYSTRVRKQYRCSGW